MVNVCIERKAYKHDRNKELTSDAAAKFGAVHKITIDHAVAATNRGSFIV